MKSGSLSARLSGIEHEQRFMKWSVSDRRSRTISPFLQATISEWLENRIKEGTVEPHRFPLHEKAKQHPADMRAPK
jgi:hypothetical protein